MNNQQEGILSKVKLNKIILPVAIGLAVVAYMLYKEFDIEAISKIDFTIITVFWLCIALLMMFFRDLGYVIRLRILTENHLSWNKCIRVVLLWEFTSAISPSAIGGTSIAPLYVHKEGINVGRSTAVVLITSFLDELYFIIMFPLLFLIVGGVDLFSIGEKLPDEGILSLTNEFFYFAIIGYSLKLAYTLFISYGLFFNPRGFKWIILQIFKLPILRKWRFGAAQAGTDLITTSKELRHKPFSFWTKAILATFFSWTSRYWVVNFMLLAFFIIDDHFLIFARQLVMWIMMLVSPTPGGSGFAEFVFSRYLNEFIPVGFALTSALLWRMISYYPYLFIGAILLPRWIKKKFGIKSNKKTN